MKQKHKIWRKLFNESCLRRDKNKCVFCDSTEDLDVHHIVDRHDMPNGGYSSSNGITVCKDHHLSCEFREKGFTEDILYDMIGVTFDQAYQDCLDLYDSV